jgi:rubrerythrin
MRCSSGVLQAIETAIQIEKDGLAFYTEAAGQVHDRKGKQMFLSLARDEAAHLDLFEDARRALLNGGAWPSPEHTSALSSGECSAPSIFPLGDEFKTVEGPESHLTVLQQGIEAEEASIAFYADQMSKIEDPDGRAMYAYLIEQEKLHRATLQQEYTYQAYCLETAHRPVIEVVQLAKIVPQR